MDFEFELGFFFWILWILNLSCFLGGVGGGPGVCVGVEGANLQGSIKLFCGLAHANKSTDGRVSWGMEHLLGVCNCTGP